jgi:hypothetical protein
MILLEALHQEQLVQLEMTHLEVLHQEQQVQLETQEHLELQEVQILILDRALVEEVLEEEITKN